MKKYESVFILDIRKTDDNGAAFCNCFAELIKSLGGEKPEDDLKALEMLSKLTGTEITRPLRGLAERKVNFKDVIDAPEMLDKDAADSLAFQRYMFDGNM